MELERVKQGCYFTLTREAEPVTGRTETSGCMYRGDRVDTGQASPAYKAVLAVKAARKALHMLVKPEDTG